MISKIHATVVSERLAHGQLNYFTTHKNLTQKQIGNKFDMKLLYSMHMSQTICLSSSRYVMKLFHKLYSIVVSNHSLKLPFWQIPESSLAGDIISICMQSVTPKSSIFGPVFVPKHTVNLLALLMTANCIYDLI